MSTPDLPFHRRPIHVGVHVLLLVVIGLLAWSLFRPHHWRYRVATVSEGQWEVEMNLAGEQGWELVSARRGIGEANTPAYEVIFKRPIP